MGEGAERSARAVARVLDVVALGRLVDLGVELLLGAGVAVLAAVPAITVHGVPPLVRRLHRGARRAPVLELLGTPPPVFVVMELWARVPLPAQNMGRNNCEIDVKQWYWYWYVGKSLSPC